MGARGVLELAAPKPVSAAKSAKLKAAAKARKASVAAAVKAEKAKIRAKVAATKKNKVKLGAIVAAPLNLVGAPLNFIINNAKGGYARIRNFKPKA